MLASMATKGGGLKGVGGGGGARRRDVIKTRCRLKVKAMAISLQMQTQNKRNYIQVAAHHCPLPSQGFSKALQLQAPAAHRHPFWMCRYRYTTAAGRGLN
jgi:hypothetical protein